MKKNPAAVKLGRLGGKVKSFAKSISSRLNGKKGGRPKLETEAKPQDKGMTVV